MEPHKVVSELLTTVAEFAKPGIALYTLDKLAEQIIFEKGARSYNRGYHPNWSKTPFPANICLNVNYIIAHGIANQYRLKDGDILSIDAGIIINGQCGDAALTVPIGNISDMDKRLLKHAKRALYAGIKAVKPKASVLDIGKAIQIYTDKMGYVANKKLTGHGIGKSMHEEPTVFGFNVKPFLDGKELKKYDVPLEVGQIICIEPMITYKDDQGKLDENGWTWYTKDRRNSALFEHMVKVTETGYEVLTTHIYQDENQNNVRNNSTPKRAD